MRIYLAAPFFTSPQLEVVRKIEDLLKDTNHLWYSPRSDGVLINMAPAERQAHKAKIFRTNCEKLDWADTILAVVDGRDSGTTWELGYAFAKSKRILTYTEEGYGLNVMIQESVDAHFKGIEQASAFLFACERGYSSEAAAKYRDFQPGVF